MATDPVDDVFADAPGPFRKVAQRYRWFLRQQWRLGWSSQRRRLIAAALLFGLSALVVMAQLQSILGAMHLPGETSFTLTDLAFPDRSRAAVETWFAHAAETTEKFSGPLLVTIVFALVDSLVLVPAYAIFLSIATAEAHRRLKQAFEAELELPEEKRDPLLPAYRRLAAAAFLAVPPLVVFDLLENADVVAIVAWEGEAPAVVRWALTVLWAGKWLLALGIVVPLLLAAVALVKRTGIEGRGFLTTAVVLRVELVVVLILSLFLFGPVAAEQMDDVLRRWISPEWTELVAASILTALLSAVIVAVAWRLLVRTHRAEEELESRKEARAREQAGRDAEKPAEDRADFGPQPIGPRPPLFAGLALIAVGLVLQGADLGGTGVVALGIVLTIIGALSIPLRKVKVAPRHPPSSGSVALPAVLGAIPLVLLGLASLRAAVFELVYARNGEYVLLIAFGLLVQLIGWGVYVAVCKGAPKEDEKAPWLAASRWPLPVAVVTSSLIAAATWLDPWWTGEVTGTMGVLVGFLIAVIVLGYGARLLEIRSLAPPFFLVFGIRRFPVFLIVAAWALVAAIADPGGYHNVRTIDRAAGEPVTLKQAWQRWLGQQPDGDEAVPLVLVAAEGGGIRAAYWTARALDCVLDADVASCGYEQNREPGDPGSIFAASGISGGSLGLVAHAAAVRQGDRSNWADKRLGDDFLAAAGAWMLFTDLPNSLLKLEIRPDRAAVLERAWQKAWGEDSPLAEGLLETWADDPEVPLLLLSGTSVQDGCRVNNSVLDADVEEVTTAKALRARDCLSMGAFASDSGAPLEDSAFAATHDLFDLLCATEDVRLSTAALLSARFPWVSPAGRIPRCGTSFATYAVDGGYFDTSAASPIQELWARLEPLVRNHNQSNAVPCVVPVLLQLDNHYKEPRNPGATGRPWETVVPLAAVRAARDARENNARQAAALLFSTPTVAGVTPSDGEILPRYAHLFPRAHPGTSAPLGWALSQASMDDLTNQLGERANEREFEKIRRWFSKAITCTPSTE